MNTNRFHRRSLRVVAVAAAALAAVGGVAVAAIPNADGSLSACFSKKNGALKVIDSATQACASNEGSARLATADATGKVANADKIDGLDASQLKGIAHEATVQRDYNLAQGQCTTDVAELPEGIPSGRPVVVTSHMGFGYGDGLVLNNGITQLVGESTSPLITWTACNMGAEDIPSLTITLAVLA